MAANTTNLDVLTGTGTIPHRPERLKYGTSIVWNPEIRPIEVVVIPGWLPLRVEIEAVVRWPMSYVRVGEVE
jgi:hypothetical protein